MTTLLEEKYTAEKQQFIAEAQELLLFNCWSQTLLEDISQHCGFNKDYHYLLFPDGVREVVEFFENWQDQKMMLQLQEQTQITQLRIREKIALALQIRIKNISKLIHIRNNAYFILPENIFFAMRMAWNSCNLIWYYTGDTATDFNHYSKRGLLVSVYLSAILFYIADESENAVDTDRFIDDALENIINIAKLKNFAKLPELSSIPILRLFTR
ncbi:COQ9 family protein [Candidatus Trichorickettsia mobilis]|uniref:COQ9 family protein n=1 Tax=Candidatus Trichorickettsia mobilis TaxID=1346319 RepID=UPI00292D821D|nr:COQ9 family protein [Candidatus Trichorickettsia mobilis]